MKVKTLSIRQPWAELIMLGKKTIELRTWSTHYRGPLAIHVSQTMMREECLDYHLDPKRLPTGAVIGIVDLVNIIEFDQALFKELAKQHLGRGYMYEQLYGWELANPRRLSKPLPAKGRLHLFEVEVEEV